MITIVVWNGEEDEDYLKKLVTYWRWSASAETGEIVNPAHVLGGPKDHSIRRLVKQSYFETEMTLEEDKGGSITWQLWQANVEFGTFREPTA